MTMTTAAAWILIISAVGTLLVSTINAIAAGWGRREAKAAADSASAKLDVIHTSTNGTMTAMQAQLTVALSRIESLEMLLRRTPTP
jgi:hypothetical protein